jgi:putative transposase
VSLKQRLYPDPAQVPGLVLHCAHARFVWNLALEQANMWSRAKSDRGVPAPNNAVRMRQLAEARKVEPWLAAGSSSVQQAALRDFDQAQRNWWKGSHKRPTWRKAHLHNGFVIRDLTVRRLNRKWAVVTVPKVGPVRFRLTRAWAAVEAATSARVSCDRAGRWHVSLVCPPPAFIRARTGSVIGIDRGVANTITTSTGLMAHAPSLSPSERDRFLTLQQRMSRQVKGSNRRNRTRIALARLHATLGDRHKDWVEQTTTALVRAHDLIFVEDLNTAGMTRRPAPKPDPATPGVWLPNRARAKAALNKAILASCWGSLEQRLTHKTTNTASDHRSTLVKVNPRNTSRMCTACGHVAAKNRESQAVFTCESCGHTAHADTNAAINILNRGLHSGASLTMPGHPPGYAAGHAVNGRISPTPVGSVKQPATAA